MRKVESNGRRPTAASSWLITLSGDGASCATTSAGIANRISASDRQIGLYILIDQDLKGEAAGAKSSRLRRGATGHAPAACPIPPSFPSAREAILTDNSP